MSDHMVTSSDVITKIQKEPFWEIRVSIMPVSSMCHLESTNPVVRDLIVCTSYVQRLVTNLLRTVETVMQPTCADLLSPDITLSDKTTKKH